MQATQSKVSQMMSEYFGTEVYVNETSQIVKEDTNQILGQVMVGEEDVIEHLRTLALDAGNEWNGVDTPDLYDAPSELRQGLRYVGENEDEIGVWYQSYA